MTIDEAIEVLQQDIPCERDTDLIEAIEMAIKALEQEPIVTSTEDNAEMIYPQVEGITPTIVRDVPDINVGDLISRQAVLDLPKIKTRNTWGEVIYESVDVEDVKQLPSVKPQTGHWIYTPQRRLIDETDEGGVYITDYRCTCSECGGDFGFRKMSDAYCKYCGARISENPTSSKPEISSYYGLKSYVRERSEE